MILATVVTAAGVLGVVSPATTLSRSVPQAVQLLRTTAEGVSEGTWMLILVLAELWTVYGVLAHVPAEIVTNVPNGALAFVIVILVGRRRHATGAVLARAMALSVAAAGLTTACVLGDARGVVSVVAVVGSLGLYIPQLLKVLREREVAGISLSSWVIALAAAVSWGIYGLVIHRPPIYIPSVVLIPTSLAIVLRVALVRSRALPRAVPPAELAPCPCGPAIATSRIGRIGRVLGLSSDRRRSDGVR